MTVEETLARFFPKHDTVLNAPSVVQHIAASDSADGRLQVAHEKHTGWGGHPHADDGYDLMDLLCPQRQPLFAGVDPTAWNPVSEAGEWPYVIWFCHPRGRALMQYVEGDLYLFAFSSDEDLETAIDWAVSP